MLKCGTRQLSHPGLGGRDAGKQNKTKKQIGVILYKDKKKKKTDYVSQRMTRALQPCRIIQ